MKGVRQADDLFVCFGAKPTKAWARDLDATGIGQRNAFRGELEEGTYRRQLAKSDAEGQSTPDSRREQSAWDSPGAVRKTS